MRQTMPTARKWPGARRTWVRSLRAATVTVLVFGGARCGSPFGPSEAGLAVPKDPGRVSVHVHDQSGSGVQNAYVCVEMPNNVGSFFKECGWTSSGGGTNFLAVPAGRRRVDVTPPAGYSAGAAGLVRDVDVVKGTESRVAFELTRQ